MPNDKVVDLEKRRKERDREKIERVFDEARGIMSDDPGFQRPGMGAFLDVWENQGLLEVLKKFRAERNDLDGRTRDTLEERLRHTVEDPDSGYTVEKEQIDDLRSYAERSDFPGYRRKHQGWTESIWRNAFFSADEEARTDAYEALDPRELTRAEWLAGLKVYDEWTAAISDAAKALYGLRMVKGIRNALKILQP